MPLIALRVVCGYEDTIDTGSPLAVFKKVDLPADGRPIIVTSAVFGPAGASPVVSTSSPAVGETALPAGCEFVPPALTKSFGFKGVSMPASIPEKAPFVRENFLKYSVFLLFCVIIYLRKSGAIVVSFCAEHNSVL